jgi:hypothetical protein
MISRNYVLPHPLSPCLSGNNDNLTMAHCVTHGKRQAHVSADGQSSHCKLVILIHTDDDKRERAVCVLEHLYHMQGLATPQLALLNAEMRICAPKQIERLSHPHCYMCIKCGSEAAPIIVTSFGLVLLGCDFGHHYLDRPSRRLAISAAAGNRALSIVY